MGGGGRVGRLGLACLSNEAGLELHCCNPPWPAGSPTSLTTRVDFPDGFPIFTTVNPHIGQYQRQDGAGSPSRLANWRLAAANPALLATRPTPLAGEGSLTSSPTLPEAVR